MNQYFTDDEFVLLKGKYASLARKYKVSTMYVKLIANGKRKVNTKLSKMILDDMKRMVELFRPISSMELSKIKELKEGPE